MALASELERGKFFEYRGDIMQVLKKEIVVYGTHSHSKLKLTVANLNGKGEKAITLGHNDRVDILDIQKKIAQVIAKTPQGIQIMDTVSYETLDASADEEIAEQINEGDNVVFIHYNNNVMILGKK